MLGQGARGKGYGRAARPWPPLRPWKNMPSAKGPRVLVLRSLGEGGCSAKIPVGNHAIGGRAARLEVLDGLWRNPEGWFELGTVSS